MNGSCLHYAENLLSSVFDLYSIGRGPLQRTHVMGPFQKIFKLISWGVSDVTCRLKDICEPDEILQQPQ